MEKCLVVKVKKQKIFFSKKQRFQLQTIIFNKLQNILLDQKERFSNLHLAGLSLLKKSHVLSLKFA